MKSVFAGATALAAVVAAPALADTVVSVTQTSYDYLGHPTCVAVRMNPSTYGSLPVDTTPGTGYPRISDAACKMATTSTAYGPDRITKNVYDAAGQLVQSIQGYQQGTVLPLPPPPADQRTYATYTYGLDGEVVDAIDANGNHSKTEYDSLIRVKKHSYPSTTVASAYDPSTPATALSTANAVSTTDYETFTYDANDKRTGWRRRDATMIYDCYDNLGRTVRESVGSSACTTSGAATDVFTHYDSLGHIDAKRFGSTTATSGVFYAYDGLGRISSTTDYNGRTIGYAYNQASSKTRVVYPDGGFADYGSGNSGYSTRDALERVGVAQYSDTTVLFTFVYTSLGHLQYLKRGLSGAGGMTTYVSDKIGHVTSMTNDTDSTGTTYDIAWGFSYNPAGQVVSLSSSNTAFDYKEYTSATVNQSYDGLNRDAGVAAITGGYDALGNLTAEGTTVGAVNAFGDPARRFTYDKFNRLLTASNATGSTANLILVYDPEGRLAKYSTDNGTNYTTFLYDGTALIGEYAGTSTTIAERYVQGPGTDQPLVWYHGSGTGSTYRRYIYTNYQGSVVSYTNSSGVTQETYQYDPYGKPEINRANPGSTDPWSASSFRIRYTGQQMLSGANVRLYYYKARVYEPVYGHFMQTDPIGTKDDLDLYAYVGDDPVNKSDPTGLRGWISSLNCFSGCRGTSGAITESYDSGWFDYNDYLAVLDILNTLITNPPLDGELELTTPNTDNGKNQGTGQFGSQVRDGTPHKGADFKADIGSNTYAVANGKVTQADGKSATFGNQVVISIGYGIYVQYAHLSAIDVNVGDAVTGGQILGLTGDTGNAKGMAQPHLHMEIRLGLGGGSTYGRADAFNHLIDPWDALHPHCWRCSRGR